MGGDIRRRTQQRIVASRGKPLIFSMKAKYDGALRVQSRGVLSYLIFIRALSGASREIEFREFAALLLPPTFSRSKDAAKEERKRKMRMNKFLLGMLMATVVFGACGADDMPEWKVLEKQIVQKRGELKKLRLDNPSHIWGDANQSVFLRKRMPKQGETRYYAKQVVDVRPFCVCEHASIKDGGTKARHSKRHSKRSLDQTSQDYQCPESELCPAWKQWRDATIKVEKTRSLNEMIDPVADELDELEKKYKECLEERDRERKENLIRKQQEKTSQKRN